MKQSETEIYLDTVNPLQKVIKRKGYTYTQKHTSTAYVYEQCDDSGRVVGYEVFRHKVQKRRESQIGGRDVVFPARVRFPADEDFGNWAWSFMSYEKALQKYFDLQTGS